MNNPIYGYKYANVAYNMSLDSQESHQPAIAQRTLLSPFTLQKRRMRFLPVLLAVTPAFYALELTFILVGDVIQTVMWSKATTMHDTITLWVLLLLKYLLYLSISDN